MRLLATLFAVSLSFSATAADLQRISVATEGAGSDVVLIHGLNSSPKVWREMMAAVPGHRYHLVTIKGFAGNGGDVGKGQGAVVAPVAEEVAKYIADSKLGKPAVIGHSMGGTIGLMVAARHPDAVGKLMVVDMVPFLGALFGPPGTTADSIKPMADGLLASMRSAEPEARRQRAIGTLNSMINTEAKRPAAIEDSLTSTPDVSARAYHELVVTDLRPELAAIKAPLTVLYVVPKGFMTPEKIDAAYQAAYAPVKQARLKRIDDSAHFIMWDQPALFQTEVKQFLDAK
jgi:pimeloyl-ACP methyl ester carboxylesterase